MFSVAMVTIYWSIETVLDQNQRDDAFFFKTWHFIHLFSWNLKSGPQNSTPKPNLSLIQWKLRKLEFKGGTSHKNDDNVIEAKWRWRHQPFSRVWGKYDPNDITTKFQLRLTCNTGVMTMGFKSWEKARSKQGFKRYFLAMLSSRRGDSRMSLSHTE